MHCSIFYVDAMDYIVDAFSIQLLSNSRFVDYVVDTQSMHRLLVDASSIYRLCNSRCIDVFVDASSMHLLLNSRCIDASSMHLLNNSFNTNTFRSLL